MTGNKSTGVPVMVTLLALSITSANLWAGQQQYRFPPMEEAIQMDNQNYPVASPAKVQATPTPKATVKTYQRTVPANAVPPVARPYAAPRPYAVPNPYTGPRVPYTRPMPNRPYPPYAVNRGPVYYPAPLPNGAPPPNFRAPGAPMATGAVPPPNLRTPGAPIAAGAVPPPNLRAPGAPLASGAVPPPYYNPGPYRPYPGPWNPAYRSGRFSNHSFGRNFFNKGPFKNGPFGDKSPPWEYDEDDHFGFFDMIPSEELEEIWDEVIAGPEDGNIPGPMNWPSLEMPGPFEVGEQVEDVMYEIPSFFGDGYGYDSEDDQRW